MGEEIHKVVVRRQQLRSAELSRSKKRGGMRGEQRLKDPGFIKRKAILRQSRHIFKRASRPSERTMVLSTR